MSQQREIVTVYVTIRPAQEIRTHALAELETIPTVH